MSNRKWIACANPTRLNHRKALSELNLISWRMNRINFQVGDVVFLYMKDTKRIEYKTIVTEINADRKDGGYWYDTPPDTKCATLELVSWVPDDDRLTWAFLSEYGFSPLKLQIPTYRDTKLIEYVNTLFE